MFAANACVAAIKEGCELYKQVKEQVVEVIDTANEVKEIAQEAHGFIGAFIQWLAPKPIEAVKVIPKAKKKRKEINEQDVYNEIAKNLVNFYNHQQALIVRLNELEHLSQTVYDPNANNMELALNRVIWRKQIEQMEVTLRETMTYFVPKELEALWSDTQEMIGRIKEEQEYARQKELAEKRYKLWQRNQQKGKWHLRAIVLLATLFLIGYLHLLAQILSKQAKTTPFI